MWSRILVFTLLSSSMLAQQGKPSAPASAVPKIDDDFVHTQFSSTCRLDPKFAPMTGDLNSDGIEDLVLVARCKNALIEQDEKDYKVIDPMDSFYGYGNPAITSSIGQEDPRLKGISVLIIHGAGPEAWRSDKPLAKFVVINLEVKMVALKKMKLNKKRSETAIYVEEATGDQMTSAIFWDGKKYKYAPLGSATEE